VTEGRRLVEEFGCSGCHEIEGLERAKKIGPELKVSAAEDKVGAELSTIGSKPLELFDFGRTTIPRTRKDYLLAKLARPRAFREGLRMPDFELDPGERETLVTLLLGFSSQEMPRRLMVPAAAGAFDPGGAAGLLIRDLQCLTCHRIHGVGGDYAPDLSFEGSRARVEWIEAFLKAPDPIRPLLQQMPKFNLTAGEARTLAEFINVSLRDPRFEEQPPAAVEGSAPEGLRLYRERGCGLCHQIGVEGGTVGPELTSVHQRLQPGYVRHHLLDPRLARADGPEPRYTWTDEELAHMLAFLQSPRPRSE
jgi:cytochrome c2